MEDPERYICVGDALKTIAFRNFAEIVDIVQVGFDRIAFTTHVEDSLDAEPDFAGGEIWQYQL